MTFVTVVIWIWLAQGMSGTSTRCGLIGVGVALSEEVHHHGVGAFRAYD